MTTSAAIASETIMKRCVTGKMKVKRLMYETIVANPELIAAGNAHKGNRFIAHNMMVRSIWRKKPVIISMMFRCEEFCLSV
jgi:hypothetical protein